MQGSLLDRFKLLLLRDACEADGAGGKIGVHHLGGGVYNRLATTLGVQLSL